MLLAQHHLDSTLHSLLPSVLQLCKMHDFQLRLLLAKRHVVNFACLLAPQLYSFLPGRHIHTVTQCVIAVSSY